ncbi:hypothetical protein R2601_03143 [Salipiger bermudensis HTCC2601]|uniref:Uncharacterized protein n=1 Tax=Salipiger bermudensis (strain DSM 26914 / JCM 13377 / KCTC 12554 / HTCC2601) TaxID=314265 RepID=Q0FWL7_SALBH|nr:hypothetical protein R2601_03143 [Salipiger bermudensis HTCC2601]
MKRLYPSPWLSRSAAAAEKNSSQVEGTGMPAASSVVLLKKNTRPVVDSGRPLSLPCTVTVAS